MIVTYVVTEQNFIVQTIDWCFTQIECIAKVVGKVCLGPIALNDLDHDDAFVRVPTDDATTV